MTQPGPYQVGPYDSVHLYLQWGGLLPGNESWSCGLRLAGSGDATAAATAGLVGAGAAVAAYHTRATTSIWYPAKLSFVKLNAIATTGRYVLQSTNEATFADLSGQGSNNSISVPNQIALAVSLTTGFSRGPAHRGRFFLPLPAMPVNGDGTVPQQLVQGVGTSTDQLLADLRSAVTGWDPSVFSRKAGAAGHRTITGVEVGGVLDTQRRRRRSLVEMYA